MKCIICKSDQTNIIRSIKSPYFDESYYLYSCNKCFSCFFDIKQHEVDLEELYENRAENNSVNFDITFKPQFVWKHEVQTIRKLHEKPIASVLDLGCRTGDFLMHWPQNIERIGVEISDISASVAVKRGLEIKKGLLEEIEFDRRFDVITCYAIVEHLRDPISFINKLPYLVNSCGMVVIMIPTFQCLKQKVITSQDKRWHMFSPPEYLNFLSKQMLDNIMDNLGFNLVRRRYTSGGMVNPFQRIPMLNKLFARFMLILECYTPLAWVPIFDHMYSYYMRKS